MSSLSPVQQEARYAGIGGSDAGVIAGVNPRKTPVTLWLEKTRRTPPEDLSDNELVEWGVELEEIIGKVWARRRSQRLGREVKIRRVNRTLKSKLNPFMLAHIDFDIVGSNEGLECKNAAWWMRDFWGDEETDDVPLYYLIQGVHYMHVWDTEAWNFGVLVGGNELRSYRVTRDMEAEKQLIELESKFWTCVENDTPPPPIRVEDLVKLHPTTTGSVPATEEVIIAVEEYKRLKAEEKEREVRLDAIKLAVGTFMGGASDLVDPTDNEITIATYRAHNETRVDSKRFKAEAAAEISAAIKAAAGGAASWPEFWEAVGKYGAEGVAEQLVKGFLKTGSVRKFLPK
jgi:putative phage-type endonuclease